MVLSNNSSGEALPFEHQKRRGEGVGKVLILMMENHIWTSDIFFTSGKVYSDTKY